MNATRATAVGDLAALHPALSILHEMYPNHELREIDPIVFASNPTVLPSSIQCYVQRRDVVLFLRRTASNAYLFKVLEADHAMMIGHGDGGTFRRYVVIDLMLYHLDNYLHLRRADVAAAYFRGALQNFMALGLEGFACARCHGAAGAQPIDCVHCGHKLCRACYAQLCRLAYDSTPRQLDVLCPHCARLLSGNPAFIVPAPPGAAATN